MAKYKRDITQVLSLLKENQAGQLIAKAPMKIMCPVRYSEIGLGQVGIDNYVYGLFAIMLENGLYAVMNVTALIAIDPYKFSITTIDEVDYHEFYFDTGDVVIKTLDVVKDESIIFKVFNEFVFQGKVPWYVSYRDVGLLLSTAKKYAGSNVSQNPEVLEFIASMIARSIEDRTIPIREVAKSAADFADSNIDYVALKSVFYTVKSTVNKLTGSYFKDGVTSALVNPTTSVDKLERILRT